MSGLLFEKPRPLALDRQARKAARAHLDRAESAKAKQRAGGRCECVILGEGRCRRRDTETHHMLAGHGRRLTAEGMRAERKQRLCAEHHRLIQQRIVERLGGVMPRWTDHYRRRS